MPTAASTRALLLWADDRSGDLGVRALAAGTAAWCRRALGDVEVVCHNDGASVAPTRIDGLRALAREKVTGRDGLADFFASFDVVVDTRGGDSFNDISGLRRLATHSTAGFLAARAGVPVVLGPQTIGPFGGRASRGIARRSLTSATAVLARDSASARVASELGRPVDATTTDVVFSLDVPTVARHHDVLVNVSGLLWHPNPHLDHRRYREAVTAAVEALRADGRQVALLAHVIDSGDHDDVSAIREFVAQRDDDLEVLVPTSLDNVREMVASAALVVGSRLPACLNALSVGTPAIALAHSGNVAPVLDDLGWRHLVDLRSADPQRLAVTVREIAGRADLGDAVNEVRAIGAQRTRVADELLSRVVEQGVRHQGRALRARVDAVVESGCCSGCGACTRLDRNLTMQLSPQGYARPTATGPSAPVPGAATMFDQVCPGVIVSRPEVDGAAVHPVLGPYLGIWAANAADEDVRSRGSSGGALTALVQWLLDSGRAATATAVSADRADPRTTVPVTITTRAEAMRAAGSRYAPVAACSSPAATGPANVFVGKPCEASAVRRLTAHTGAGEPVVLSFFCAGVPSQAATDQLVSELGVDQDAPLRDLWYRGHGWPGSFTVVPETGEAVATSYEHAWGDVLGRALQWRCKICPDGVGESADIVAGDYWDTDDRGYPTFAEGAGRSVLIARTRRGLELVKEAAAAGAVELAPVAPDDVAAVQPLQTDRRATMAARLAGARAAGLRVPAYHGFGLLQQSIGRPRESWRMAKGSFARARRTRQARP